MKRLETILALSATVLFCGCGGSPASAPDNSARTSAPQITTILGNWQFTAASTAPGKAPLTFDGSIARTGPAVSGALHLDGSNCFDRSTTISLAGTVTADGTSLTSAPMAGQVIAFKGNFTDPTFNGTYKISGGCTVGDQGTLTGVNISNIGNNLSGTFTNSAQKTFNVTGKIAQTNSASSAGSFEISGTTGFDTPCFSSGTIQPGTFPTGSFILGRSIALEVETGNGILTFLGTLDQDGTGEVKGNYTVAGGACDDTGAAVLHVAGAWDY
jgi:hypothetical protein